jgi:hypothetical protein
MSEGSPVNYLGKAVLKDSVDGDLDLNLGLGLEGNLQEELFCADYKEFKEFFSSLSSGLEATKQRLLSQTPEYRNYLALSDEEVLVRESRRLRLLAPEVVGELPPFRRRASSFAGGAVDTVKKEQVGKVNNKMGSDVKFRKFDERVDTVEEWLKDFERAALAKGNSSKEKLTTFPCFLGGTLNRWFEIYESRHQELQGDNHDQIWANLKAAVLKELGGSNNADQWELRLKERRQVPGEQYQSYAYEVLQLCDKVDQAMSEQRRVRHVLKGLMPRFINKVDMMENNTVEELLSNLSKAESSFLMQQGQLDEVASPRRDTQGVVTNVGRDDQAVSRQEFMNGLRELKTAFISAIHGTQPQVQQHFRSREQSRERGYNERTNYDREPYYRNSGNSGQRDVGFDRSGASQGQQSFRPTAQQDSGYVDKRDSAETGARRQPDQGQDRGRQRSVWGKPRCYICNRIGHFALTCPEKEKVDRFLAEGANNSKN